MTQSGAASLSPDKERQILLGAAQIFAQDGYEGASMSRIALAANVSKGTLYNYFASKADLFGAYVRMVCAERIAGVFGDIEPDGAMEEMLFNLGTRMLKMFFSDAGLTIYRVVMAEAPKFPSLADAFFSAGPQTALRHIAQLLQAGADRGQLRIGDADFAAQQFCALMQTTLLLRRRLHLIRDVGDDEIAQVVRGGVAMFLGYYGAIPGR